MGKELNKIGALMEKAQTPFDTRALSVDLIAQESTHKVSNSEMYLRVRSLKALKVSIKI